VATNFVITGFVVVVAAAVEGSIEAVENAAGFEIVELVSSINYCSTITVIIACISRCNYNTFD